MIVIPAIDLMNNCCVRLSQGKFEEQTIYSKNPVETAKTFEATGFSHLHIVDLDGARVRQPKHLHVLQNISSSTALKVDYSGGIRSLEQAAEVFEKGADALTIGSMAVNDPETVEAIIEKFGSQRLILGADVKNGRIATAGWQEESDYVLDDFLKRWVSKGLLRVMITDVSKDGMMQGPAVELYKDVLQKFPGLQLIASGGIASMDDIRELAVMGCYGAITGKALYENSLNMDELKEFLQ